MLKPRSARSGYADDFSPLNGCWVVTDARLAGLRLPEDVRHEWTLRVHGGRFTLGEDEGTISIDRGAHPAVLELFTTDGPRAGRFLPAIFEQAGGMLRICYDLSGERRPLEFKAPAGTRHLLATYRRAEIERQRAV